MCDNVSEWRRSVMQRIRIQKKPAVQRRDDRDPYAVLPIDPRDPAILRAKQLLRERVRTGAGGS